MSRDVVAEGDEIVLEDSAASVAEKRTDPWVRGWVLDGVVKASDEESDNAAATMAEAAGKMRFVMVIKNRM